MEESSIATTIIATRQSRLALWQAEYVKDLLEQRFGLTVNLLGLTTRGDEILDKTLSKVGGKGLFVKELETALEGGRAHLAVHSLKDVPMDLPDGFDLVAVLERDDPRDALVSNRFGDLASLPQGACVGTSSLRRVSQLLSMRPDLRIEPLRGNINTRLRKLDEGGYDAIVLAAAGLKRLSLEGRITQYFGVDVMVPAGAQGALGIETRSDVDPALRRHLASLTHRPTLLAATAERAVSRALGGSCSMPLAAYATWNLDRMHLSVALGHATVLGMPLLRLEIDGNVTDEDAARALGERAAAMLREQGAAQYLGGESAARIE